MISKFWFVIHFWNVISFIIYFKDYLTPCLVSIWFLSKYFRDVLKIQKLQANLLSPVWVVICRFISAILCIWVGQYGHAYVPSSNLIGSFWNIKDKQTQQKSKQTQHKINKHRQMYILEKSASILCTNPLKLKALKNIFSFHINCSVFEIFAGGVLPPSAQPKWRPWIWIWSLSFLLEP